MSTIKQAAPAATEADEKILSSIVTNGDLSKLSPDQKVAYYRNFCERLGLDPLSQPFAILRLNGKEIMYCGRAGAQQLSKLHDVSHEIKAREMVNGCYLVTAQASTPDGRRTESIGAVPVDNLKGDSLCNAFMKAETKAKRRATLDLLGLGILDDDSEATPAGSKPVEVKLPAEPKPAQAEEIETEKPAEPKPAPQPKQETKTPPVPAAKEGTAGKPEKTEAEEAAGKLEAYKTTLAGFVALDELNDFLVNLREQPAELREAIKGPFQQKIVDLNAYYDAIAKKYLDIGVPQSTPAKQDLKWFQDRIGKTVFAKNPEPKQFSGPMRIADEKFAAGSHKVYQGEHGMLFSDWAPTPPKAV